MEAEISPHVQSLQTVQLSPDEVFFTPVSGPHNLYLENKLINVDGITKAKEGLGNIWEWVQDQPAFAKVVELGAALEAAQLVHSLQEAHAKAVHENGGHPLSYDNLVQLGKNVLKDHMGQIGFTTVLAALAAFMDEHSLQKRHMDDHPQPETLTMPPPTAPIRPPALAMPDQQPPYMQPPATFTPSSLSVAPNEVPYNPPASTPPSRWRRAVLFIFSPYPEDRLIPFWKE